MNALDEMEVRAAIDEVLAEAIIKHTKVYKNPESRRDAVATLIKRYPTMQTSWLAWINEQLEIAA